VASLSQGRTAAAQCGLFTYKSVPVIFEPPCILLTALLNVSQLVNSARRTHGNNKHFYIVDGYMYITKNSTKGRLCCVAMATLLD